MVQCPGDEPLYARWVDGEFIHAFVCTYAPDPASQAFFALVMFGGIGLGLFIYSGSIVLPAVLGIMLAGAIFVFLPPSVTNLALVVGLLTISIGGIYLVRRLDRR